VTWLSNDLVERLRDVATRPELATNRYVILRPIGRGGMGSVYAARDEQLGREVAIKVSNAAAPADDLDQRLRREAKVLARLEHPGIVPVHDAGLLDDGRWFYVMKLVRGETLADHAASLEHEAARLVVFERVAETVAFAHAAGIVHRDLKPSNVMVGQFGEVLVLDWGVARVLARVDRDGRPAAGAAGRHLDGAGDGTSGGTRMGTAGFMAPEQAHGDSSNAGPPADVYALGAMLFWMWTGSAAPADLDEVSRSLGAASPAPSKRLAAMISKSLSAAPADRYASAKELVDDLARYRQGAAVSAYRETTFERAGRWLIRYQTFVWLVLSYLVMRVAFAFLR
jgi:eukaryotic-like serine/threonine-protein kinase